MSHFLCFIIVCFDYIDFLWWYIAIVRKLARVLNNVYVFTTTESSPRIWYQYNAFKPPPPFPVAYAAVRSKATVLLLLIYCLLSLPLFDGVLCLVHIFLFSNLCPSSFAIIFMGKRELVACLNWLPDVLWQSVLYSSSLRCRGLVCCVWCGSTCFFNIITYNCSCICIFKQCALWYD